MWRDNSADNAVVQYFNTADLTDSKYMNFHDVNTIRTGSVNHMISATMNTVGDELVACFGDSSSDSTFQFLFLHKLSVPLFNVLDTKSY